MASPIFIEEHICQDDASPTQCLRLVLAGRRVGALLADLNEQEIPRYDTPDQTVVRKTLRSYPELIQCRLDTYLAGFMDWERPRCWYRP